MDSITETAKDSSKETIGFFKYVFNFDEDNKNAMLNLLQYAILTIIPVLLILKVTRAYVPEIDEEKGSLEILAESLFQIVFIFLSLWFVNRMIFYIPTYSGKAYREINEVCFILPFMFILLTIQTKLGEKINILADRAMSLWSGETSAKDEKKNANVRVKQPLAHQPSQADGLQYTGMMPGMPPPPAQMTNMKAQTNENSLPRQQYPDYNQMYQGPNTPLIGANTPGLTEPMAANEGYGVFGSAW